MSTVGQIIKSARIAKKASLEQVSEELKISINTLKDIELDCSIEDKNITFLIGHLRSYSNFLNLDSDKIIKMFKEQISFDKNNIVEIIQKPEIRNQNIQLQKFVPISIILFVFISFYLLFIKENNDNLQYALVPNVPEIYEPVIEKAEIIKNQNNLIDKTYEKVKDESFNFTSVNASNQSNEILNEKTVTLKILSPTWLQLRDESNNIIISQLMEKGDEYSYDMSLNYNITSGNAGNILVVIDKQVRGKIGDYGDVVDSITLDNNFNN